MKIALISDTHGNLAAWEAAWDLVLHDADLIIHCGDALYHGPKFKPADGYDAGALAARLSACPIPILMARGNADSEVDQLVLSFPMQQPYLFAQVGRLRLLAAHGHQMSPEDLLVLGEQWRLDFVVTGHTHVPACRRRGCTLHLNPGTTTYPLSPDPALRRRTCAAIIDGAPRWWDLESGEELTLPTGEMER